MFCHNCGYELPDSAKFCNKCGTRLEQPKEQPVTVQQAAPVQQVAVAEKKPGSGKSKALIALIIVLAVLLVGAAAAIVVMLVNNGGDSNSHSSFGYSDDIDDVDEDDEDIDDVDDDDDDSSESYTDNLVSSAHSVYVTEDGIVYDGKLIKGSEGTAQGFLSASLSGDCFLIKRSSSELTAVKNGRIYDFEAGDLGHGCSVAASGDGIAYHNDNGSVKLLDTNTGKITVIEEGVIDVEESVDFGGITISPDGRTVLYSDGYTVKLYRNGSSKEIFSSDDRDNCVASVSNNGEYIFVFDIKGILYCLNDEGDVIRKIDVRNGSFQTNRDNTQIAFLDKERQLCGIYDAKKNAIRNCNFGIASDYRFGPVAEYTLDAYRRRLSSQSVIGMAAITHYNVDDLTNCFYSTPSGFLEVRDGNAEIICEETTLIKKIYGGGLAYWDRNSSSKSLYIRLNGSSEKIDDMVCGFGVSESGRSIFYFTEDDKLHLYRNGNSEVIAEDVCVENYSSGLNFIGVGIPTILGENTIVYPGNDEKWYIYNDGKTDMLSGEKIRQYGSQNSVYGTHLETIFINTSRNGASFITNKYLVYEKDDEVMIMDESGKPRPLSY